jgi:diguanylate cyclase (GGDEF)-like protein/PAS domain S-box-containing protein
VTDSRPPHILIVDDEPIHRKLLQINLEQLGYKTMIADSGEAALALASPDIDLVLMDVNLPGMTGFDATRLLRADPRYANLPIIVVTALNSREERLDAVRAGANDYLTKPVDEAELQFRVGTQLKIKRAYDTLAHQQQQLETLMQARTQQLEEQHRELQIMNAVLENAVEGISHLNSEGCFLKVNASLAQMFGYTIESMFRMHWHEIVDTDDVEAFEAALQQMQHQGKAEIELQARSAGGSPFYVHAVLVQASSGSQTGSDYYCFMKDISERKSLEQEVSYHAFHDPLTGLPNRLLFMKHLEHVQSKLAWDQKPFAVLFIDLDNFKLVNDSLGHEAGDQLLILVSERLKSCSDLNVMVSRLAGDEFTLLMEQIDGPQDAIAMAESLMETLYHPMFLKGSQCFISGSIGIAYVDQATPSSDPLRDADTAMYHAKTHGKAGYALFEPGMNDLLRDRMEIENGLRFALERNEFRVHYQPLIDLGTGSICGVEALVRWEHPTQGLIAPGRFLPTAEETGMIVPIGYWVMEEACRQSREWHTLYPNLPLVMNVNLSGKQLERDDVVERVAEILHRTEMDPTQLKLEITESVMMAGISQIITKMKQLKALGVKLALDDFGTGYSSLACLHEFPLDTIKIDRSFIHRLSSNEEAASIVNAIIMMSKSLNIDVTGEGVEAEEHVVQLQSMGCDVGQGYYFAKPLVPNAVRDRIDAGRKIDFTDRDEAKRNIIETLLQQMNGDAEPKAA